MINIIKICAVLGLVALAIASIGDAEGKDITSQLRSVSQWNKYCDTTDNPVDLCSNYEMNTGTPFKFTMDDYVNFSKIHSMGRRMITGFEPDGQDEWHMPTSDSEHIDCDDFAIYTMTKLLESGVPRDSMRLAITKTWLGYHVVVIIETEKKWIVIDNMRKNLIYYDDINDYHGLIKVQVDRFPRIWIKVEN